MRKIFSRLDRPREKANFGAQASVQFLFNIGLLRLGSLLPIIGFLI
jgi:hypothetical protein